VAFEGLDGLIYPDPVKIDREVRWFPFGGPLPQIRAGDTLLGEGFGGVLRSYSSFDSGSSAFGSSFGGDVVPNG
jgi:hypothetical protein